MRRLSIGVRLTLWYVAIFAIAQVVFGAGMWFILRHNLYDMVDDDLESQIADLKSFLQARKKDASVATLQQEVNDTYGIEHSGDYLEIHIDEWRSDLSVGFSAGAPVLGFSSCSIQSASGAKPHHRRTSVPLYLHKARWRERPRLHGGHGRPSRRCRGDALAVPIVSADVRSVVAVDRRGRRLLAEPPGPGSRGRSRAKCSRSRRSESQ